MAPSAVTTYFPVQDVVEAPAPVLTTVQDIGIHDGAAVNGATIQTVDARRLHGYLKSAQDFSTWIKSRIETYGFEQGKDFTTIQNSAPQIYGAVLNGGQNRIDYHVSLDMAKELAMVEKTEKDKEARNYFIQCEKKLNEVAPGSVKIPTCPCSPLSPHYDCVRYTGVITVLRDSVGSFVKRGHDVLARSVAPD